MCCFNPLHFIGKERTIHENRVVTIPCGCRGEPASQVGEDDNRKGLSLRGTYEGTIPEHIVFAVYDRAKKNKPVKKALL